MRRARGAGPGANWLQVVLRVLAMLLVVTLNPQLVNISATYSASALCLAWIELGRSQRLQTDAALRSYACASGVLFAGLCALKTTFVLLSAGLFGLTLCALMAYVGLRRALTWAAVCSGAWVLLLLPWLAVHAKLYMAASDGSRIQLLDTLATPYQVQPLSLDPILYGGDSLAMYTFSTLVCAVLAVYACWSSPRAAAESYWPTRPWAAYLGLSSAACLVLVYITMLYAVAPRSQGAVTIVRLYAPIFIALAAGCVTLTARLAYAATFPARLTPLLFTLAIGMPFVHGVANRFGEVLRSGSLLAFPYLAEDTNYLRYNADVLYGTFAKRTALAQAAVPVGAPLIAFINTPFWLDFKRNSIADIEPAGLATPWSRIPRAAYVLWEYNGFATSQLERLRARARPPQPTASTHWRRRPTPHPRLDPALPKLPAALQRRPHPRTQAAHKNHASGRLSRHETHALSPAIPKNARKPARLAKPPSVLTECQLGDPSNSCHTEPHEPLVSSSSRREHFHEPSSFQ